LNKIDLVRRDRLLGLADTLSRQGNFDPIFMISGIRGDGVEDVKRHLAASLPTGSFYQAFAPEEAERLCEKLEIHYTPVHGSWLNMAEIELAVLAGHPLNGRIGDAAQLARDVSAWQQTRNAKAVTVDWRFTTADSRIKLKHLYPSIEP
jgi:hypothetical protein